jgi:hypothetical protein
MSQLWNAGTHRNIVSPYCPFPAPGQFDCIIRLNEKVPVDRTHRFVEVTTSIRANDIAIKNFQGARGDIEVFNEGIAAILAINQVIHSDFYVGDMEFSDFVIWTAKCIMIYLTHKEIMSAIQPALRTPINPSQKI